MITKFTKHTLLWGRGRVNENKNWFHTLSTFNPFFIIFRGGSEKVYVSYTQLNVNIYWWPLKKIYTFIINEHCMLCFVNLVFMVCWNMLMPGVEIYTFKAILSWRSWYSPAWQINRIINIVKWPPTVILTLLCQWHLNECSA